MEEKRKVCIPLKKIEIDFKKDIQNDENSIKNYLSVFDLNPDANYLALVKIKEYKDKYLYKYKYTLNYKDAKKLGCFQEVNETNLINSINQKLDFLLFQGKRIESIEILSKAKLIDFFLYLILLKISEDNFENIMKEINSLRLGIDLIFKAPIYLGNDELKYYFLYEKFVEYFSDTEEKENKSKQKNNIFKSLTLDYFPTFEQNSSEYSDVVLDEFDKRKQNLFDFIKDDLKKNIDLFENIEIETPKESIIELDEDSEFKMENKDNKQSSNIKTTKNKNNRNKKKYKIFKKKLEYFKNYKDAILGIFFDGKDDKKIIEILTYLYFYMLLTIKSNNSYDQRFINALYMKNNEFDKEKIDEYDNQIQSLFNGDYDKLFIKNIAIPEDFFENIGDPFINNYFCFSFPDLMHKSFIEYDKEIYEEFLDFLKYIYKSQLLQHIYYLCPEFKDFEYPFKNDDILKEMFENTHYIPCNSNELYGYTQKNLLSIFIPINFEDQLKNDLEHFVIRLGFILNTTIHEQLNHYIKTLLFYNSFRFLGKKYIESDEEINNDENKYLKGLMSKKRTKNKISDEKAGGHRAEIYLYREVLERLTCIQGLKMFYKSTWSNSIEGHFSDFKDNYKKQLKTTSTVDGNSFFDLNEVFKDSDVCPFFKSLLKKFIQHKKINNLAINLNYSEKKEPESFDDDLDIRINIDYEMILERANIRDYSH